jgi:hypothetical protein
VQALVDDAVFHERALADLEFGLLAITEKEIS